MISAIIIDDEPKIRTVLAMKIKRHCPEVDILAEGGSVQDGVELIIKYKPELVFLDISMPDGTGFELLDHFKTIDFEIIFVTGYNDYVLRALRVSAVDYLLKPVITADLVDAVCRASEQINENKSLEHYAVLKHNIKQENKQSSMISLPGSEDHRYVIVSEIICCEGWQKYTKVHLSDGTMYTSSYNIGYYVDLLEEYDFFRIHKSYFINLHHIDSFLKDRMVLLSNGQKYAVSRRREKEFKKRMNLNQS